MGLDHDSLLMLLEASLAVIVGLVSFIGAWVIRETSKNTTALQELTGELKYIHEKLEPIPKLENDVQRLMNWKRETKLANGKL